MDDLLGEGLRWGPLLVTKPLEIDHSVPSLVSPADPPHADAACGIQGTATVGTHPRSRPHRHRAARSPVWSRPPVFFMPTGRTVYLTRHFHRGLVVQRGTEPPSPRRAAASTPPATPDGGKKSGGTENRVRSGAADNRSAPKARHSPAAITAVAEGRGLCRKRERGGRGLRRKRREGAPPGGGARPRRRGRGGGGGHVGFKGAAPLKEEGGAGSRPAPPPSYRDFDRNSSTASRRLPPPLLPRPHTEQVVGRAGSWCSGLGRFSGPTPGARGVGWSSVCVCVCVCGEQRENGATPTGEPLTWNRARGGVVVGEPDNRARRSRSRPVRSAIRTLVARTLEPWDPALSGPGASSWVGGGGGARCLLSAENRSPPERGVLVTRGDTRTRFPVPAVAAPSVLWDSLVYN